MKKLVILSAIMALLFSGCGPITDKIVGKLTPQVKYHVSMDSTHNFDVDVPHIAATHNDDGSIYLYSQGDSTSISLTFSNPVVGKYEVNVGDSTIKDFATFQFDEALNIYLATSGEIEITDIKSTSVDVKFHFSGTNALGQTVDITNGTGENLIFMQ